MGKQACPPRSKRKIITHEDIRFNNLIMAETQNRKPCRILKQKMTYPREQFYNGKAGHLPKIIAKSARMN